MNRVERVALKLGGYVAVSIAFSALIASGAAAQTMGEYGMAVGHAAASSSAMPSMAPPSVSPPPSENANPSGSSRTEEVRTYDEPATGEVSQDEDQNSDKSSGDDWSQVK